MKLIIIILKLLSTAIVFMVTGIVFMFATASYLPRVIGANYYDHGCFDGVTYLMLELEEDNIKDKESIARAQCEATTKKLKEKGYLFAN